MASQIYTPLSVRFTSGVQAARAALEEARHSNPVLISLARRLNRDPTILLLGFLAILTSILLLDPEGIAPGISNVLAFLPAIATLRHVDSSVSLAKAEQGKFLLDYWVCIGTSFVLEQVFSNEVVGGLIPVWCMAGRAGAPKGLTLNANKARSNGETLPEPEPSPSPIADSLSALLHGAGPYSGGETTESPVDTAAFLRDNAGPFTVVEPAARPPKSNNQGALNLGKLDELRQDPSSGAHPPRSPGDQLDAFLDSTATDHHTAHTRPDHHAARNNGPESDEDWSERRDPIDGEAYPDDALSPAFILDGSLAEQEHVPLVRLPHHADALDGGPQAKDKGGEAAKGRERRMTLDDLIALEDSGH
ncbi:uncharacterized protein MKK02DRAFT_38739 [Dioszegia hungarica]|uniref:Uncharacterized protein n=1 Tax=Dioszegia hungarica TaxID=4972 RepID=A0AA38H537_9TREE|nr:uncharacterized protein MKK02DRAFT_38739 [Dioszegia hungarica]KAI9634068.1 hypothetical protein MKK02DRAFT_38739 [Dioszegia hungarica]